MSEHNYAEYEKETENTRVLTKQEELSFDGATFDEMGRQDEPPKTEIPFVNIRYYSPNPLVAIGGTILFLILGIFFGGVFLVLAGIFSVLAFLSRLFK